MELGEQAYYKDILPGQENWKGFLDELINELDLKSQLRQLGEEYSRLI